MRILAPMILLLALIPGTVLAEAAPVPDKAPCFVCTFGGAGHGVEKVAAHSRVDGALYTFCSKDCKERFDADPVGYLPPAYPLPAPEFALTTTGGDAVTLAGFRGRWLLLDFWATWCAPCIKLMPELDRLDAERPDLTVLGVSIDEDTKKAAKFAEKRDIGYPVAVDDPEAPTWDAYRVKAVPTVFLIDPEGRIVQRWIGKWDHDDVAAVVDSLSVE